MRVDPGDSTDIIHKRIFKGAHPWRAVGPGSLGLVLPEQALIKRFPAEFRAQDHIQPGRWRFTDEVQ
jgi:hypothetical protein